jgi:starch phosphorylase
MTVREDFVGRVLLNAIKRYNVSAHKSFSEMHMQEERGTSTPSGQEDIRTGMSAEAIRQSVLDNLYFRLAKTPQTATRNDWYMSFAYAVRDRMMRDWVGTLRNFTEDLTVVACLSAEFVIGPQLGINLINLGIHDQVFQAAKELGLNLSELIGQEQEPGLGSGGAGRFAACFMDSLSMCRVPAIGYGIRYEFGSFAQEIRDGWQVEICDKWLKNGNPWEIRHPEVTYDVNIGGLTESYYDEQDAFRVRWIPKFSIKGTAYDTPVAGYRVAVTNLLRLWKAGAAESFGSQNINAGDYFGAVNEKIASESIGKILYPDDEPYAGKHLRLAQQYFFVSCSLQDMIRLHLLRWKNIHTFSNSFAVQLNGAEPAIAVAELMRLLVDEHLVNWDKAWYITQNALSYTNYAVLSESLQKWPLPLFAGILPRHLEIIYEINRRFLDEIWLKYPDDNDKLNRLSLIDESDQKYVRIAHLAGLGCHAVNGVSEIHSEFLKKTVLSDLYEVYPERFFTVTNGVTPRRWIVLSNPRLAGLLTATIGDGWIGELKELKRLEPYADDQDFMERWQRIRHENKFDLSGIIRERTGISVDPGALFDIQMKRVSEYKRQHLNALHIITLYNRIKKNPDMAIAPRTFIFGGKSSPGYFLAKLIIKLIYSVGEVVNNDPDVAGRLKVVFFPDFNVKHGQLFYPAADLSEHISTAGREASATGNMKFSMNGSLTISSRNGTNMEIGEEVGPENFFLFGLTAEEVYDMKSRGHDPMAYYDADPELKGVIDLVNSGFFSRKDPDLFKPLADSLLCRDEHMVLADYRSYIECHDHIGEIYKEREKWTRMSILTIARMGKFSSDRSVHEYNEKIWHASPLKGDPEYTE